MVNVMFRFIAQLLIVSMLSLSFARAGDECAFSALDDANSLSLSAQINDRSPPNFSDTNFDCDAWCHVWANPAALLSIVILSSNTLVVTINSGLYTRSYGSLSIPPPFHPPIV